MDQYQYIGYIFLFARLAVFVLIVAALIVFGIILIKAAKKRREKRAEAIHQLFNPDDDKDTVNISLDNSNGNSEKNTYEEDIKL